MLIQNNKYDHSFRATFVQNQAFIKLDKYASKQANYSKFEKAIKNLEKLPNKELVISYRNFEFMPEHDYGGALKLGLIKPLSGTELTLTDNDKPLNEGSITLRTHKNIKPLKYAYETLIDSWHEYVFFFSKGTHKDKPE